MPDNDWQRPDDYEECGICGYDHGYDGCDPAVYAKMRSAHEEAERNGNSPEIHSGETRYQPRRVALEERAMNAEKGCVCTVGDPCDYHAATCITCVGGCQGHPVNDCVATFDPEVDAAHRAAEFEHNIQGRMADRAKTHAKIPRYWLEEDRFVVFVLVGLRQDGDGPDPTSWIRYLYPEDDMQLSAADRSCQRMCLPRHMSQAHFETEESGDAIWHGYEFNPGVWDQVKDVMTMLLGEPGVAPPRLANRKEDES